ncbi:MAG: wax ester/triacylglycerol synthase family O-acyltransferase [Nocardioides sp.]|nr:wax ester/triacylglycerol synthase family O-acyltransferase [Nocardioides sp.]
MERMEGVDAGYLYMETPTQHMHTLKIAIIEPAPGLSFEAFSTGLLDRLDDLPPLRRRVLPVPFALNHPMWVADRPIDPKRHFFQRQVPAPGGMAELEEVVGRIAGTPLARDVPLWEIHLCEGLAGGRVAVVAKLHHAIADGNAANALLANVTDEAAAGRPRPTVGSGLEPTPGRAALVRSALVDAIVQIGSVPGLVWRTARALVALVAHKRRSSVATPRPVLDAPRVSFNGPLSSRRVFATCSLPLEKIKEVGRQHDVSVNDVVLAVVAGALRSWMDERGERPLSSLLAGVPVGTDKRGAPPRLGGNRVSNLFTTLATDVDDPVARLQLISRTTREAKQVQSTLGLEMLADWVQFTPPAPFSAGMRLYSRSRAASLHHAPFNVIVSNVPGPRVPAQVERARLSDLFSVGPILEGIGLNITAWSYVDRMNFSALSCPELVSDLGSLMSRFRSALDELERP